MWANADKRDQHLKQLQCTKVEDPDDDDFTLSSEDEAGDLCSDEEIIEGSE